MMHRTYISAIKYSRRSICIENIQIIVDALGIETFKPLLKARLSYDSHTGGFY